MATGIAIRWRPAAYRSTTETILMPGNPEADPPTGGQRVQTLQLVVYDDTKLGTTGNPYRPGAPETEQHLAIVDEVPISMEVDAFAGLTAAQSTAQWNAARDAQIAVWEADPSIQGKINAAIGGHLSSLVIWTGA